jgi:FixJ family two-component response regulator
MLPCGSRTTTTATARAERFVLAELRMDERRVGYAMRPVTAASGQGTKNRGYAMNDRPLVAVVDDSQSVRESLPDLLEQIGVAVEAFGSAEAFLESGAVDAARCLVLDVGLPGMSGPELQQELGRRGKMLPIVFITGQGDGSLAPRLLAAGAVAFLLKPFSDSAVLDAVGTALELP